MGEFMKVTVIGCSTSWTDRPTSSYCINDNLLVDAGEGTLKFYKQCGIDFEKIEHIFITHTHSDHTFACINLIYNAIWHHNRNHDKQLYIYGPEGIEKYFKDLRDIILPEYKNIDISGFIHFCEITNFNSTLKVGDIKVRVYELQHKDLQDIAYVFDDGITKVGFSGDCTYTKNLDKFINDANVLYLECCDMTTNIKHLGYDKFIEYTRKYPNKKFWAIHCEDNVYHNADKLGISVAKSGQISEYE